MRRRDFIKMVGLTSGAIAAGVEGARAREQLISHLHTPVEPIGDRLSICTECPATCAARVRIRDGHPIKLDGDGSALCLRGQASLGRLYHPERLARPQAKQPDGSWQAISWDDALRRIDQELSAGRTSFYLSSRTTGALTHLIDAFGRQRQVEILPEFEIFHHGALREAYQTLVGLPQVPCYDLSGVDDLITFSAELLEGGLDPVGHAAATSTLPNWLHLEPHLSLTGCAADHRWVVRPGSEAALLARLLHQSRPKRSLPEEVRRAVPEISREEAARRSGLTPDQVDHLVALLSNPERSTLVLCGGPTTAPLPAALLTGLLQWSADQIGHGVDFNRAENLDRVGNPIRIAERASALPRALGVGIVSRIHSLRHLPAARELLSRATLAVGLSDFLHADLDACGIVLPLTHALESWVDVEPRRGGHRRCEPVFDPLFDTRSEGEILLALMGRSESYATYLENAPAPPAPRRPRDLQVREVIAHLRAIELPPEPDGPQLIVTPSLRTYDGRSRMITLLHEIPDPISAVTYGAYASLSEEDAEGRGLKERDDVELATPHGAITLPLRIQPGLPAGIAALAIDHLTDDVCLPIDPESGEYIRCIPALDLRPTSSRGDLPILSGSMDASGRGILPGDETHHGGKHGEPRRLYPPPPHARYRWAMAIDLDRCTGCSACVAACYVENNIPIVGPDEHRKGREMSWLRIQPYRGRERTLEFVPMLCQHCDQAPCESVCPVYATYHNPEGLNAQVYNRCVGTRYCANNCPYKARRFNWFAVPREKPLDLLLNPDVSVRPAGVMEKCTFCIQRIRAAKDRAQDEGRGVVDGDVVPACAEACPTEAITFGNLLDPSSRIHALAHSSRAYHILESLGCGPAVTYLHKDQDHES